MNEWVALGGAFVLSGVFLAIVGYAISAPRAVGREGIMVCNTTGVPEGFDPPSAALIQVSPRPTESGYDSDGVPHLVFRRGGEST